MQDEQEACLGSPRHEVRLIGSSLKDKVYKPTTTINKKPSLRPQICAAISSTSYFLIVGMGFSYSGILIPQLEINPNDNVTSNNSLHVTKQETSWIASSFILVMPLGALLAGMAMEYVGRLNTIKLAAIPCSIGWILIATAQSVPQLIIGRVITGIFSGFGMSPPVVYVTEIANPKLRSSLISFAPTFMSLAMLLLYWSNMYLSWRQTAWLAQMYIAVPFTLAFLFPESPIWLVSKGRTEDAEKALRWLNGQERAESQISTLVKSQEQLNSTRNKLSLKSRLLLFTKPSGYKPVIILITLFIFQQFSGIYTTLFYAVTFLQDVRSAMDPGITTVLLGIVRFVMSFVISFLMRHFGRRPLLMFSCLTECASMLVSGYFSYTILAAPDHGEAGETSWGPPICLLVYVCTSMLGFLSIPWVITAEFFPIEIRSLGHGITNASAYLLMFLAVQTYRPLVEALGTHVVQWSFAGMALAAATFVYFFVPETRGKTLSEITHFFDEPQDKGNNNCTSNGVKAFDDPEAQEKLQPH